MKLDRILTILSAGGRCVSRLEAGWQGRQQWRYTLRDATGATVPGYGTVSWSSVEGLVVRVMITTVSAEYMLPAFRPDH